MLEKVLAKDTPDRKGKYYVQRNNDKRSLVTRFGLLEFERTYYKSIKEEKYTYILDQLHGCSAEGHISHILSARLSSRPMGWSLTGLDEMARMRAFKANGGSVKGYYRNQRIERKTNNRIR